MYKKMDNTTYYQRNKETMLNRARDYYGNDKERLKDKQEINIETYLKKIKRKRENMEKNRYHMSEEKKQDLKEYQKQRYQEVKESKNNNEQNSFLIMI